MFDDIITFGVSVSDRTIIHEFLHAATQSGFKRNYAFSGFSKDVAPYSSHMSKNQMFDEVVIEYLALEIYNRRSEKQTIINKKDSNSDYRVLFEPMKAFIDKEMGNIKDAQMAHEELSQKPDSAFEKMLTAMKNALNIKEMPTNPADYFSAIIGEENFNKIALMCNEVMSLSYPANITEITMLDGTVSNDKWDINQMSKIYADIMSDELKGLTKDVSNRNRTKLHDFVDNIKSIPSTLRDAFNTGERNMDEINRHMNNTHHQDDNMSM